MSRVFAFVVAAGRGARFGGAKQFAAIDGRSLLHCAVAPLCAHPKIDSVAVVVAADKPAPDSAGFDEKKVRFLAKGGDTRARTVANALADFSFAADDWALVHDAARPCLSAAALDRLFAAAARNPRAGALLALPVADTIKSARDGCARATLDRADKFAAQTPQMFPAQTLRRALEQALAAGDNPTDESAAMERAGFAPSLARGEARNIKITDPDDLRIAAAILTAARI